MDSVEPKLFGIGAESYTPGSHEFYLGYAVSRQILLTLDAGHYHPTEGIADKISSVLCYLPEIALHVSRGVRWDSDHVVTLTDELAGHRPGNRLGRLRSAACASAWITSTPASTASPPGSSARATCVKALLLALVAPIDKLKQLEAEGDYTSRLALMEDAKVLPAGAVWDYYCQKMDVPVGEAWLAEVKSYERTVLCANAI